jgi:signal peptidase I
MRKAAKGAFIISMLVALVAGLVLLVSGVLPYKVYVVHTGSMSPTIPSRSAVIVREGDYGLGQVVSYRTDNGIVTHRLVGADGAKLRTKGDANRTADPSTISRAQVIGGVVAAPRMLGYWIVYFKNPAGLASLFLAVICAWLVYSLPADVAGARIRGGRGELHDRRSETRVPQLMPVPHAAPPRSQGSPQVQEGLLFRCSGCRAGFGSAEELRAHVERFPRRKTPVPARDARWGFPVELLPRSPWQKAT